MMLDIAPMMSFVISKHTIGSIDTNPMIEINVYIILAQFLDLNIKNKKKRVIIVPIR
ncbi:MAG: hypothetical protein N4A33_09320 [Bacteriovoracaceae bacterium]|jgi:hypothetical protein|nr:hypothetical protein [Bacteriovoracaceae bacterium]